MTEQPYDPTDPFWMFENVNGVTKVSYWSLSTFQQCPAKYNFTAKQPPLPPSTVLDKRNAVVGSIEHTVIENFFNAKEFTPTSFEDQVEPVLASFESRENVVWRSPEDKTLVIQEIKDDLSKTFDLFRRENLLHDAARPECTIKAYLTHRILLKGRIDLYIPDPDDAVVIDNKAVQDPNRVDRKQLVFYRLLIRRAGLPVPKRMGWYLTKFDTIKWANVTEKDELALVSEIEEAVQGIRDKKFPYKPNRYTCQWCDFREICDAYKNAFPNQQLLTEIKSSLVQSGVVDF